MKCSIETRKKISNSLKGHPVSIETRRKIGAKSKFYKRTPEHLEALRKSIAGKPRRPETRMKISKANTGKHPTATTIIKLRLSHIKNNYRKLTKNRHKTREAKEWRRKVFERDAYTCQECGNRGYPIKLQAHHIIPFSTIVEKYNLKSIIDIMKCKELWDINNGITLCTLCHKKTNSYGKRAVFIEHPKQLNLSIETDIKK